MDKWFIGVISADGVVFATSVVFFFRLKNVTPSKLVGLNLIRIW